MKIDKRSKEWKQAKKVAYETIENDKSYENITTDEYKELYELRALDAYKIITDVKASNDNIIPETKDNALKSFPDGIGDKVEIILKKTGVKKIVEIFTKGKDCGCDERKEKLNAWGVEMGITRKVECLTEREYNWIKEYNKRHNPKHFSKEDVFELNKQIYARVFNKRISLCQNCNSSVKKMNNIVKDLNKLVEFYELEELKP